MDSLLSFPVGLFHPLQHAGLSRRTRFTDYTAVELIPKHCGVYGGSTARINCPGLPECDTQHNQTTQRYQFPSRSTVRIVMMRQQCSLSSCVERGAAALEDPYNASFSDAWAKSLNRGSS